MSIIIESLISNLSYISSTQELVDTTNESINLLNTVLANQASGAIENTGLIDNYAKVNFKTSTTTIELASNNYRNIDSNVITIELVNWKFYFADKRIIMTIDSLDIPVASIGTTGVHYVYLNSDGQIITVDTQYMVSTPSLIRLMRVEQNSDGTLYSVVIMPEVSSTTKLIRSFIHNYEIMHIRDTVIEGNSDLTVKRLSSKYFTEGCGFLETDDMHTQTLEDDNVAELLYLTDYLSVPEAPNTVTSLDVTHYSNSITTLPDDTYAIQQLYLSYDGKLLVQYGTKTYSTLSDAVINIRYDYFPAIIGDTAREYRPVARIAYSNATIDLSDSSQAVIVSVLDPLTIALMWNNY
jgi:hypothetical protein